MATSLTRSRFLTAAWLLLLLLGLFPVLASLADLAADLQVGLPADHQATFAQLAGLPWAAAQHALAGPARYVTTLEIGYAVHELVFGLLFLLIVAVPLRRGERWAWWACWLVLIADIAYTLTFGAYDPTIHRQSLIADAALPILLLAQLPRFLGTSARAEAHRTGAEHQAGSPRRAAQPSRTP